MKISDFLDVSSIFGSNPPPPPTHCARFSDNLGEIVKSRVEHKMHLEHGPNRYSEDVLRGNLVEVLQELEDDHELFETLLCSMPKRLAAVRDANGGHTDY